MLQVLQDIRRSYFQMLCYWIGLYDSAMAEVVKQRKSACKNCPLNKDGWCSKSKHVSIIDYPYKNIFSKTKTKVISGCSCWIKAKVFSTNRKSCPLNRWKQFKIYGN